MMFIKEECPLTVVGGLGQPQWNEILERFPERDIYFTFEYIKSSLILDAGEPLLFHFKSANGEVAYPVVKRKIDNQQGLELYDITTPYGHGGPLVAATEDREALLWEFRGYMEDYCRTHLIVSEFVRFHPLLKNHRGLEQHMEIVTIGQAVEIPLQLEEELFDAIPGKTRNMIRKAMNSGVEVRELDPDEFFTEFLDIYYSTMDRNSATDYYYFEESYFRELFATLQSNVHLFGAFLDGRMISAAIIYTSEGFMHYHLSGSLEAYRSYGVNNLLLHHIAEWGREMGKTNFYLGGGYSYKEDGLFQFKKSFSKSAPLDYFIGKQVHLPAIYEMLNEEKGLTEDNGFFPLYRSKN